MRHFYSYLLRKKETGAQIGYGHGIVENLDFHDIDDIDRLCLIIIDDLEEEITEGQGATEVHLQSLTPLL